MRCQVVYARELQVHLGRLEVSSATFLLQLGVQQVINHYYHWKYRQVLPEALDSVSSASINRCFHHCERLIEAYGAGEVYGTKECAEWVYKSHRQVVDKSKW